MCITELSSDIILLYRNEEYSFRWGSYAMSDITVPVTLKSMPQYSDLEYSDLYTAQGIRFLLGECNWNSESEVLVYHPGPRRGVFTESHVVATLHTPTTLIGTGQGFY